MPRLALAAALVGVLAVPLAGQAQPPDKPQLALKARAALEAHCFPCHGKDGKRAGAFGYALDVPKMIANKILVPGKLDEGVIVRILASDDAEKMPPPTAKSRPSAAEIDTLKAWVLAGAPAFEAVAAAAPKARPHLSDRDVYQAMADYLRKHHEYAQYKRFLTLTHLHNDPAITDKTLRLYHAGVSKLLNSLSWRRDVVLPRIVDVHGAVLAIDLRDLDWDLNDAWHKLVCRDVEAKHPGYVYALTHDRDPDETELNLFAREVYALSKSRIPAVRADWFLAAASLPPLYHELLNLPKTAGELEKRLGVDVALNFRRDYLVRAGLELSGVAVRANRLLERHASNYGGYWKSYDFATNAGKSSLRRFPLGPVNLFARGKHPFEAAAFEHDGGELIFNLPNGLQGYLLVNKDGARLDTAPDIVGDDSAFAGRGATIVNGLSCMGCHKHGMIDKDVKDAVRLTAALAGPERDKMMALYPEQRVIDRWMKVDRDVFLRSLERAIGPYVRLADDEKRPLEQFAEPVTALATPYLRGNLTLEQAGRELGMKDMNSLKIAIENHPVLSDLLMSLAVGGTIKREFWEAIDKNGMSVFQRSANALKRGAARVENR